MTRMVRICLVPVIDYNPLSPFSDVQQPIVDQTNLSERLGIDPNDVTSMSSAAALAVDSGASPVAQQAMPETGLSRDDFIQAWRDSAQQDNQIESTEP